MVNVFVKQNRKTVLDYTMSERYNCLLKPKATEK